MAAKFFVKCRGVAFAKSRLPLGGGPRLPRGKAVDCARSSFCTRPLRRYTMPHSYGFRARTRHMFAKAFGERGAPNISTYLKTYHVGDYVDIKVNGAVHKGMPYKFYHGRTGIVYNVTKGALGIIVHKRVGNRFMEKRINVRIEHVRLSKCRQDFLARVASNDALRRAGKPEQVAKRTPALPRVGHFVSTKKATIESVCPVPYEALI